MYYHLIPVPDVLAQELRTEKNIACPTCRHRKADVMKFLRHLLFLPTLFLSCHDTESPPFIKGIYGSPVPLWEKGWTLPEIGVNAIFLHSGSITKDIMDRARREGVMVFAEFPTLNGKNYIESHAEAWPINAQGEKAEAASWFMGVCPTEPNFREYRLAQLRALLREFDLNGVWMDYVHWHAQFEEEEPILPETCFCENCLRSFEQATGIDVPAGTTAEQASWILGNRDREWRNWRCGVLAEWASHIKDILHQERPGALLGMFHCPWTDEEYGRARRRILGIDYDTLRGVVDVFSPMVYHGRMGKSAEWVRENIAWFSDRMRIRPGVFPKVWPIVQAYDDPRPISGEEFERVLLYGRSAASTGVMMFTSLAVAGDSAKTAVMRKVYKDSLPLMPE